MKLSISIVALLALAWMAIGPCTSPSSVDELPVLVERESPDVRPGAADSRLAPTVVDPDTSGRSHVEGAIDESVQGPVTIVEVITQADDRPRKPVPGIAFTLTIIGTGGESLWTTNDRTDGTGRAAIDVPRSLIRETDRRRLNVLVRACEPGYQRRWRYASKRLNAGLAAVSVRLNLIHGASAEGRVVDENGEGVPAKVTAQEWAQFDGGRRLEDVWGTRAHVDGARFSVHFDRPGTVVLLATSYDRGTGVLDPVTLSLSTPPQDLVIEVSGAGVLRGRVLERDGRPSVGVRLNFELATLHAFIGPEARLRRAELRAKGGGHIETATTTDERGAFEVRGLRPEEYVISVTLPDGSVPPRRVLGRAIASADSPALALQFGAPRLVVRLIRPEGAPQTSPSLMGFGRSPVVLSEWGDEWTVSVLAAGPLGTPVRARGKGRKFSRFVSDTAPPGESPWGDFNAILFEVPDGQQYLVSALGAGFDGRSTLVRVPEGAGRVDVLIHARADLDMGELRVIVTDARARLRGTGFKLTVAEPESGVPLLSSDHARYDQPKIFTLPAGPYDVTAEGTPVPIRRESGPPSARIRGRASARVQVQGGAATEVTLKLGPGGKLAIEVKGQLQPRDLEFSDRIGSALRSGAPGPEIQYAKSFATVEVVAEDGRRETVLRVFHQPFGVLTSHIEWPQTGVWPHGQTYNSTMLPCGTFTLESTLPGGRNLRVPVTIAAGETTQVLLDFGG